MWRRSFQMPSGYFQTDIFNFLSSTFFWRRQPRPCKNKTTFGYFSLEKFPRANPLRKFESDMLDRVIPGFYLSANIKTTYNKRNDLKIRFLEGLWKGLRGFFCYINRIHTNILYFVSFSTRKTRATVFETVLQVRFCST